MRIDVLSLFPRMLEGPLGSSVIGQAAANGLLEIGLTDIRDFAKDKHRTADDYQYGGGSGMVMKPEPIFEAIDHVLPDEGARNRATVILLTARGELFNQRFARRLAGKEHLVFICGHYKGVDERVASLVDHEISIGDYVLTGGEPAAIVVIDAVARLVPGVLGDFESAETDSFFEDMLGPPLYTRPEEYRGHRVPEVLLSGHHERIRLWRREQALRATLERRPDIVDAADLSEEDREILRRLSTSEERSSKSNEERS